MSLLWLLFCFVLCFLCDFCFHSRHNHRHYHHRCSPWRTTHCRVDFSQSLSQNSILIRRPYYVPSSLNCLTIRLHVNVFDDFTQCYVSSRTYHSFSVNIINMKPPGYKVVSFIHLPSPKTIPYLHLDCYCSAIYFSVLETVAL